VKQYWNNPKIVSQTVSHWLSESPNSLLLKQLELEARVGIERESFIVPSLTHSFFRAQDAAEAKRLRDEQS
jgi:hypothetical protein